MTIETNDFSTRHPDVAAWLSRENASGNSFAASLSSYLARNGRLTDNQVAAVRRSLDRPARVEPKPAANAPDLTGVPSGTYAIPGGDTRLKIAIQAVTKGKWQGWIFVKDGAEYGEGKRYGRQKPGELYAGALSDQLRTIVADPRAAMAAYGQLVGRCGVCGRKLEDETSVALGIGPICRGRFA